MTTGAVRIEHTDAEGTLLWGTSRGDGAAEVVRSLQWRWGRSIGAWFVPRSRDSAPNRDLIARTAQALESAGFFVEVEVDAAPADQQAAEDRKAARAADRAQRLTRRAERHEGKAAQRYAAGRAIADGIPFGQPLLVGHHSYPRAKRDLERMEGHMDAAVSHQRQADRAAAAAASAAAQTGARNRPETVANRVGRLSADIRRSERELQALAEAGTTDSSHGDRLRDRLTHARAELEHWQRVRAQQLEDGTATAYSRESVKAGDAVKIRGQWRRVVRANAKSVSVETGYAWTDRSPWHEVQDHRRGELRDVRPE